MIYIYNQMAKVVLLFHLSTLGLEKIRIKIIMTMAVFFKYLPPGLKTPNMPKMTVAL